MLKLPQEMKMASRPSPRRHALYCEILEICYGFVFLVCSASGDAQLPLIIFHRLFSVFVLRKYALNCVLFIAVMWNSVLWDRRWLLVLTEIEPVHTHTEAFCVYPVNTISAGCRGWWGCSRGLQADRNMIRDSGGGNDNKLEAQRWFEKAERWDSEPSRGNRRQALSPSINTIPRSAYLSFPLFILMLFLHPFSQPAFVFSCECWTSALCSDPEGD